MSRGVRSLAFFSAALLVLSLAGPTRAEGVWGPHSAFATCQTIGGSLRLSTAPMIWASSPNRNPPGTLTIGGHQQWVAYQVVLWAWSGQAWAPLSSSSWRAAQVLGPETNNVQPASWWDFETRQWVAGHPSWDLVNPGYYRAAIQFYWYADERSDAGSVYIWATHGSQEWCQL